MWIEVHQGLFRHRKTVALAAALDIQRTSAGGHMICLWLWALDNARDGDLTEITSQIVAFGAEWEGDPNAFTDALVSVGFLDKIEERLLIHDWYDYAGRLIERRKADADRKRTVRRTSGGHPADIHRMAPGHPADVRRKSAATGPNRTVPNLTSTTTAALELDELEWYKTLREIPTFARSFKDCQAYVARKGISPERAEETALALKSKWGGPATKNRRDVWGTFQHWVTRPPLKERDNGRRPALSPTATNKFAKYDDPPGENAESQGALRDSLAGRGLEPPT